MFLQCLIVICLTGACLCQCPQGWKQHNSGCYHFSTDLETWVDAKLVCTTVLDGFLAEINDESENMFLTGYVAVGPHEAWIGGNDLNINGLFVWENSKSLMNTTGYVNWHPGQPNIDSTSMGEHCVEMKKDGTWNDDECFNRQQYICEKELNSMEIIG